MTAVPAATVVPSASGTTVSVGLAGGLGELDSAGAEDSILVTVAVSEAISGAVPVGTVAVVQDGAGGHHVEVLGLYVSQDWQDRRCSSVSRAPPERYMLLPLSARINPYVFMAFRMTWFAALYPEMSKSALRRKRAPIPGRAVLTELEESWIAGKVNDARVFATVKRMA